MSKDLKKSGRVSLAIFSSRILGLVREQIFSHFFAAGIVMDAFNVAFRIPNLLRDLFAEGAMSSAFVSRFSAIRKSESDESAFELARKIITFLSLFVGLIVILAILFSDQVVNLFAPHLQEHTAELSSQMIKIMFPFLWLVSIASVFTGILNTFRRFGLPATAPALFNVGTIFGGGLCAFIFHNNGLEPILGMAFGTVIGGLLQWVLLLPSLKKTAFRFKFDFAFKHPHFKQVMVMMIPAVIGQSAFQINLLITTNYASGLAVGSISYLSYAYRFMQLPIGVFSVAIAIVSLPNLSELISEKKFDQFSRSLTSSLRLCLFFTVPASIGLYLLAKPIIRSVYGHGKFNTIEHITSTAGALRFYVLGLVAWSVVKIFVPAYYANNKTWIPMWGSFMAISTNALLCFYFINSNLFKYHEMHYSLALATTLAAMVNAFTLLIISYTYEWRIKLTSLLPFLFKLIIACAALTASVIVLNVYLIQPFEHNALWVNVSTLIVTITVSTLVFALSTFVLKIEELDIVLGKLLKRNRS